MRAVQRRTRTTRLPTWWHTRASASCERSWCRSPDQEADPAYGVDQPVAAVVIDLPPQPRDVDVDHVVEARRAHGLVPDVARQHRSRDDLSLVAHQILEHLVLAQRQLE